MDLAGKVVVVTGAASGIGASMVRQLAAKGSDVVVADIDESNGKLVAKELGDRGRYKRLDVTSLKSWTSVLDEVASELGGIDIVHCNAGVLSRPPSAPDPHDYFLPWMTEELYLKVMGINVDGVVYGTLASTPHLQARGGGKIIATSSPGGLAGWPADPYYSMSKAAVNNWVMGVAPALAEQKITINAAMPGGMINTNMFRPQWKDLPELKEITPLEPDVIAKGIVDLMERDDTNGVVYMVTPDSQLLHILPPQQPAQ